MDEFDYLQQKFWRAKEARKSAAGASDAAVVNYATFSEVHRDYLSAKDIFKLCMY